MRLSLELAAGVKFYAISRSHGGSAPVTYVVWLDVQHIYNQILVLLGVVYYLIV